MSELWKNGKREIINFNDILFILEDVSKCKQHKIIIGSDSVKLGHNFIFTKAICILNKDYYDKRYFYLRKKIQDDSYLDLSKRLLKETSDSISLAMKIRDKVNKANLEIHADINPDQNHMSSKYKNTITGYIQGCGFKVKIKPNSFVASSIADQHTRKK